MSATVDTSWKTKIKNAVEIPFLTRCCFCVPLRKGLIAFAYFNMILTVLTISALSMYIKYTRDMNEENPLVVERIDYHLITDVVALSIEALMTVVFIVALHKKHVPLMRAYLHFELVFAILGFAYSLALLTRETASELFLLLLQLNLQLYLVVLIWSSIKKMERDGAVKYTRQQDSPAPV